MYKFTIEYYDRLYHTGAIDSTSTENAMVYAGSLDEAKKKIKNVDNDFVGIANVSFEEMRNGEEIVTVSEAIKEFAERLKKLATVDHLSLDGEEIVCVDDIDNLVKEMTEEKAEGKIMFDDYMGYGRKK